MRAWPLGALITLLLASAGCATTTGSGDIRTETRDVSGFTTVDLAGSGHVVIEQGRTDSLSITAESNLLPELSSQVSNGALILGAKRSHNIRPTHDITYRVTLKELHGLRLSGSGSQTATGIDARELDIEISGSGDITMTGSAEAQTVDIAGSGTYDAIGLHTDTATVSISGSGDATLGILVTLDATISGSGNVAYTGNPRVSQDVSGSGEVVQR